MTKTTGAGTFVGDPVTPGGLTGIAFNSVGNLFGSTIAGSSSQLVQIDPTSGTLISTVGSIGMSIGDLAFQPTTNVLYGIRSRTDGAGSAGYLYTIDTTTGAATFIGDTGTGNAGGLAFAPDGTLYLTGGTTPTVPPTGNDPTGPFALYTLNPLTGAVISSVSLTQFHDGLGISPSGTLFATSVGADMSVFTINPSTGLETSIGSTTPWLASDLDFTTVPEPTAMTLLALGGLAVMRRKRR